MNILVTGAHGFLGRHVVEHLVANWLIKQTNTSSVQTPSKQDGYDLLCEEAVDTMFWKLKPDVVIHLAARVGGIGANMDAPGSFFYQNMKMGLNIIEAARLYHTKVVLVGTVCSYPSNADVPFYEGELWHGYPEPTNAPYGIAKKALGVMLDAYHRQYGMKCAYIIPANLYGPGDHCDLKNSHVIPAMVKKFVDAKNKNEESVTLWGSGHPTREFLYVKDAAEAIVEAALLVDIPVPMNIGSGEEISIKDLALTIKNLVGYKGDIIFDTSKPNGQMRRAIDSGRAFGVLDWRPKTKLIDGLRATIDDYIRSQNEDRKEDSTTG